MRPLLEPALGSGVGGRPSTPAPRSGSSRWTAPIFWALWALSAAWLASETPTASASQLPTAPALPCQAGTIVDLDGDGLPDHVIVGAEGWGREGLQYRIQLDLTTRVGPSSFTLSAEEGGLRIVPCDLNGDGHPDLVITNVWSLVPARMWINDGRGGFTQGDRTAYPRSICTEGPGVFSDTPQGTLQATVPRSHRSYIDFCVRPYFCNELVFRRLLLPLAAANPPRVAVSWPQTRAPPSSLPQQPS
jgi:hypothetical protein